MKKVVVVGGAVIDVFAYPKDKFILNDSNPGYITRSLGGVGRNIADNLARLQVDTTLITILGKDEGKKMIMQNAQEVMLKLSAVATPQGFACLMMAIVGASNSETSSKAASVSLMLL